MLVLEPSLNCCLFVHTCSSDHRQMLVRAVKKTDLFHWNENSTSVTDDMASVQCTHVNENVGVL